MSEPFTRDTIRQIVDNVVREAINDTLMPLIRDIAQKIIEDREPHMEVRAVSMMPFVLPDVDPELLEGKAKDFIVPLQAIERVEHPEGMIEWKSPESVEADMWKAVYIFPDELKGESE